MVTLRPTRKLQSLLPVTLVSTMSDTALGDWYVNRIVIRRQPLLLLVSSTSLLPIVLPARHVRALPDRLDHVVANRLQRMKIEAHVIEAELRAMRPVVVAPTVDRSVVGTMVDFAKSVPYYGGELRSDEELAGLEDWLAETPCHPASADRAVFPEQRAPDVLRATWLTANRLQPKGCTDVVH